MKRLFLIILPIVLIATSCKRDVTPQQGPELNLVAQVFQTKASASQTAFADNNLFSVWLTTDRAASLMDLQVSANYADNVKYKFVAASNKLENQESLITFPTQDAKLGIYAVYPYTASPTLSKVNSDVVYKHTVSSDQSSAANIIVSDLMTATNGSTGITAGNTADMVFFHRMAKVTLAISVPDSYKGETLTGVESVKLRNVKTKANVILSVSSVKPDNAGNYDPNTSVPATVDGTTAADITAYKYNEAAAANGFKIFNYEAIVVPQTIAAGERFIDITVKYGSTTTKVYPFFIGSKDVALTAGKSNTIGLNLAKPAPIVFGTISLDDWANPTDPFSGNLDFAAVQNKFVTKTGAISTTTFNNAVVTMSDNSTYKVVVKYVTDHYEFAFDGNSNFAEPKLYPFTINKIEFFTDATAGTTYTLAPAVAVAARSANAITL